MPGSHGTLCINSFYTETELNITEIQEYEKQILIRMKSISKDCRCPKCGYITDKYHGTYIEYSCAMKSHFRKFGNQMSGSGNHLCNYASLLA